MKTKTKCNGKMFCELLNGFYAVVSENGLFLVEIKGFETLYLSPATGQIVSIFSLFLNVREDIAIEYLGEL